MSADDFAAVYNRCLDVSAVFCVPINLFALTIIVKKTPKNMKNFARLLLNIMVWNFAANLVLVFAHPLPMQPLLCFRLDGILGHFFNSEALGHVVFGVALTLIVNVGTAMFLSFQFRFIAIACQKQLGHVRPLWGYAYCTLLHLVFSLVFIGLYQNWILQISRYPLKIDLNTQNNLFCFVPEGYRLKLLGITLFSFITVLVALILVFVSLSFYQMHKNKNFIGDATLKMQKVLLWNLITLSGIPILLAGVPFLIAIATVYFHDSPWAQITCTVCVLVLVNSGPILCIASILMFKTYREAALRALKRFSRKTIPGRWKSTVVNAPVIRKRVIPVKMAFQGKWI